MLLTITTEHSPATDLGYLLYKHPGRVQSFDLTFGQAHVFYPWATDERCTVALLLDIDPVALVRRRGNRFGLEQYVSDRPYVASSFMSVAISEVLGSALSGKCKDRPELAEAALPFEVQICPLECRGGEGFLRRLFEPLGYQVEAERQELDAAFPQWGESRYFDVRLKGVHRLQDLLSHLYVLIPVLDNEKHYWVGEDEVDKLLRHGEGWLDEHPARAEITSRYLKRRESLVQLAMSELAEETAGELPDREKNAEEEAVEKPMRLHERRLLAVVEALRDARVRTVADLGCGEGKLLQKLLGEPGLERIVGMDVSLETLRRGQRRLKLDRMPERSQKLELIQGSLMYRDRRIEGFDAATVVEVIEHLELHRLAAFERVLFEYARPRLVVLTTPNAEYNVLFESLPAGEFRHRDHRFEWSREEFGQWAQGVCERFGYEYTHHPLGDEHETYGAPSQMALFRRKEGVA